MLGKAMASLLTPIPEFHAVVESNPNCTVRPHVRLANPTDLNESPAKAIAFNSHNYLIGLAASAAVGTGIWFLLKDNAYTYFLITIGFALWLWHAFSVPPVKTPSVSHKLLFRHDGKSAPFIDATGLAQGALFGDIRHDPYQSGGTETPPHWLVEAGAIHHAHGGILYIDEIGGLDQDSQRLLLTAIQEKSLPITGRQSGSSGSMVQTNPVPCDFTLVAAGNTSDLNSLLPALRSRISGYGYEIATANSMPDTPESWLSLATFIAQEVHSDGRIPHFNDLAIAEIIAAARVNTAPGRLTTRLRDLGGLVRVAGDLATIAHSTVVHASHVKEALSLHQAIENQESFIQ